MSERTYAFDKSILRAYDIRGQWQKTLYSQDAYALGRTLGAGWSKGKQNKILVARDGRASSPALSQALLLGLQHSGVQGIDLGILPTPALYFAEAQARKEESAEGVGEVVGAIMVTGSHNPPTHNGFKLVRAGRPFFGQDLQDLAESMASSAPLVSSSPKPLQAETQHNRALCAAYIERLLQEDARYPDGTLSSVWDMGSGAGSVIVPYLVPRLRGEHRLLFSNLDATFSARSPDPGKPHALDRLRAEVARHSAQIGLAFDGDADRLVVLTSQGTRLSGDRLLLLFATDLLQNRVERAREPAPLVLCDIKTSPNILRAIEGLGGRTELVQTGHAYIKHALAARQAAMAGEVSGHLFFNDRYEGYDDALYAAVRLCAMLRTGFVVERALASLPPSFSSDELRLPVEESRKFSLVEGIQEDLAAGARKKTYSLCTLDGVRVEHTDGSWWLLRASNTEAALVLRAEASSALHCRALLNEIEVLLRRHAYAPRQPLCQSPLVDT